MTVKAELSPYKSKKLGQKRAVRIYVYDGKKRYFTLPFKVLETEFDRHKEEVRKSNPMWRQYNAIIKQKKHDLQGYLLAGNKITDYGKAKKSTSIIVFLEEFVVSKTGLKPSTIKVYKNVLKRLKEYCKYLAVEDIMFSDIDREWYYSYCDYLLANGCGRAGCGGHIKKIKRTLTIAQERGLHNNNEHRKTYFQAMKPVKKNKIFLAANEISLLEEIDLAYSKPLEKERDRWLLAYYFLMRFSDVCAIGRNNIFEVGGAKRMQYTSIKTGIKATLPVSPRALAILERYDYYMGYSSNPQANREIKKVASQAGITQIISQDGQSIPKSELVTFHTARRSAATNLRLEGASLKTIAGLGGWGQLSTLETYLSASDMDSAILAEKLDFFK